MRKLLGCALALLACCHADVVTLKNGDRVTGTVVKKDDKAITIKTAAFGVITATWDQVASVATDTPVTVELKSGETVSGKVTTTGDHITVETEGGPKEAPLPEVKAVRDAAEQRTFERLLNPNWTELWAGTASLGMAGTQGNAETLTLTAGLKAARITRTDKTSIQFTAIRASAQVNNVSAPTARAARGGWAYERNLTQRIFVNTFNDYEFDRFQNLDLRVVLGGGAGFVAWKQERSSLSFSAGGAWNREEFSATESTPGFLRNSGELYAGNDFTLKLNSTTSLLQSFKFFPNLSNPGEYRFNFDVGSTTRLMKWLTWNTSLSDRYLSNPAFGRMSNDFLYSTGLGVTFSR